MDQCITPGGRQSTPSLLINNDLRIFISIILVWTKKLLTLPDPRPIHTGMGELFLIFPNVLIKSLTIKEKLK
jgi:hypothetical protein